MSQTLHMKPTQNTLRTSVILFDHEVNAVAALYTDKRLHIAVLQHVRQLQRRVVQCDHLHH